jgi:redox-sensitive bicupin YhaK (pirin superfamily)
MIILRRTGERRVEQSNGREIWFTFDPKGDGVAPLAEGFGVLENLSEGRLSPGINAWEHESSDAETLTYVMDGAVVHSDSEGRSGIMQAGEFGLLAIVHGCSHSEANASRTTRAHLFRLRFRPPAVELVKRRQRRRFTAAERRGNLRVVASADGRNGSLLLQQDALVFSALLDPGHHVVHQLRPRRMAWLHVVCGEGVFSDLVLRDGDGVGVVDELAVAFTAEEGTELLLIDLDDQTPPRVNAEAVINSC